MLLYVKLDEWSTTSERYKHIMVAASALKDEAV